MAGWTELEQFLSKVDQELRHHEELVRDSDRYVPPSIRAEVKAARAAAKG